MVFSPLPPLAHPAQAAAHWLTACLQLSRSSKHVAQHRQAAGAAV